MQSNRVKILKAHFSCKNYTATARQFADIVGYKKHNAINLEYGLLAKDLALEYGFPELDKEQRDFDWLFFLVTFDCSGPEVQLTLKKNTVLALQHIGW